VADRQGRFTWYELITTDMAVAKQFYTKVVGWRTREASTPDMAYTLFTAGDSAVSGLMDLPVEAREKGATPRWLGYVGVDDVDAAAGRVGRLGGAVYLPPTDSDIGRISVVADPQTASLAMVEGLKFGQGEAAGPGEPGRVGWHELLAADWEEVFGFYSGLFGWQKVDAEIGITDTYQLFGAGGQTIGGMITKRAIDPVPFWLYYFNTGDIDAAAQRVKAAGGEIYEGPIELPGGSWILRCGDPQGAMFALQGTRGSATAVSWSADWGGFSSRGRLSDTTPRGKRRTPE